MEARAGEHTLFEGRPAWRALLSFYLMGILVGAGVGAILWFAASEGAAVAAFGVIVALTLVIGYVRRLFTKYLITTQRLRISKGFIRRHVQETRLERVQNVNFQQGVIDRALNVGNVDFDTAGTDDSEFQFVWVKDPEAVVRAVDDAIHGGGSAEGRPGSTPDRPEPAV